MTEHCPFCEVSNPVVFERHHIVPRRFGGSNSEENLKTLCRNCHQVVENMYDDRFYRELGVLDEKASMEKIMNTCKQALHFTVQAYEHEIGRFPETENGNLTGQARDQMGRGEEAGYVLGFYDALVHVTSHINENYRPEAPDYGVDVFEERTRDVSFDASG